MTNLIYQVAQESDAPGIQTAAAESWCATYRDIFAPQYIARFLEDAYAIDRPKRSIGNPRSLFLIAKDSERSVGFCQFGDRGDRPELFHLYVVASHWRQGIGVHLLRSVESRLIEQGVSWYYCYVHSRNDIGKAFYLHGGFTRDAARGQEDHWYLRKKLPEAGDVGL